MYTIKPGELWHVVYIDKRCCTAETGQQITADHAAFVAIRACNPIILFTQSSQYISKRPKNTTHSRIFLVMPEKKKTFTQFLFSFFFSGYSREGGLKCPATG